MNTGLLIKGFMIPIENHKEFIELWDIIKNDGKNEEGECLFNNGVYIYFTAPWCKSCKRLKPELEIFRNHFENNNNNQYQVLYSVDVQKNEFPSGFCNIRKLPSLIKLSNKKISETYFGHENIEKWINENK
jgi:thiol-disulfide isomerase/thioredoxin